MTDKSIDSLVRDQVVAIARMAAEIEVNEAKKRTPDDLNAVYRTAVQYLDAQLTSYFKNWRALYIEAYLQHALTLTTPPEQTFPVTINGRVYQSEKQVLYPSDVLNLASSTGTIGGLIYAEDADHRPYCWYAKQNIGVDLTKTSVFIVVPLLDR